MSRSFDHENLHVYAASLDYLRKLRGIMDRIPRKLSVYDQLGRASTSIPLNIAEGNGKFTSRDRCRFFDIARGSALECAACLDVLVAKALLTREDVQHLKGQLVSIVSMLVGLIKSNASDRVFEPRAEYRVEEVEGD